MVLLKKWILFIYLKLIYLAFTQFKVIHNLTKQSIILNYFLQTKSKIFIETGTYKGKTISIIQHFAKEVHTIEVFEPLFLENLIKFRNRNIIHLYLGSSPTLLPSILRKLNKPTIFFWLDAHYSGHGTGKELKICPLLSELNAIEQGIININYASVPFYILIDDWNLFNGIDEYPTKEEVITHLETLFRLINTSIENNILIVELLYLPR